MKDRHVEWRSPAYMNPPLKDQGLVSRPMAVRKCTNSLGAFVLIGHKEVVETLVPDGLQEPLTASSQ